MQKVKVKADFRRELFEWAQALVSAIIVFMLIFASIIRIIGVEGTSMVPTLHEGEKMLISKLFYTPKNGDIIMFTKKGLRVLTHKDSDYPLVKRVIGIAGDTVDINFDTHEVSVNGNVLDEPYINEPTSVGHDVEFPLVVPKGYVFVMGDNRNVSLDSRSSQVGLVDTRCILGRVYLRLFPFNNFGFVK